MHHLFCWIAANAQTLSAIAALVTALVTAAYLFFTIRIFREARRSADAAKEAAAAATKSSEVSASLHRPYMGVKSIAFQDLGDSWWKQTNWTIDWAIANFGTLPAKQVIATLDLYITDQEESLKFDLGPCRAEVFPQSSPLCITSRIDRTNKEILVIPNQENELIANVKIEYSDPHGKHYRHTAEYKFDRVHKSFAIERSDTETLGS